MVDMQAKPSFISIQEGESCDSHKTIVNCRVGGGAVFKQYRCWTSSPGMFPARYVASQVCCLPGMLPTKYVARQVCCSPGMLPPICCWDFSVETAKFFFIFWNVYIYYFIKVCVQEFHQTTSSAGPDMSLRWNSHPLSATRQFLFPSIHSFARAINPQIKKCCQKMHDRLMKYNNRETILLLPLDSVMWES